MKFCNVAGWVWMTCAIISGVLDWEAHMLTALVVSTIWFAAAIIIEEVA